MNISLCYLSSQIDRTSIYTSPIPMVVCTHARFQKIGGHILNFPRTDLGGAGDGPLWDDQGMKVFINRGSDHEVGEVDSRCRESA